MKETKVYVDKQIGQKFGRLTILEYAGKSNNKSILVKCRCDCGKECVKLLCRLKSGNTLSCGCLKNDILMNRNTKHNLSKTHLYKIYNEIKNRCYNSKDKIYQRYGAKGIKMNENWLGKNGFISFYNWAINNGYYYEKLSNGRSKLTIDRIDNNKGYSPDNCRWVTNEEQANNKKNNVIIEINGEKKHLREIAKEKNIKFNTLFKRLRYLNMPIEKVIENTDFRKNNGGYRVHKKGV